MKQTNNLSGSKLSLNNFKRTKIIASVGPSTSSPEKIKALIKAGANGIRLNFSHGDPEEKTNSINWARQAANELGKPIAIIQDIQGPKIRLGEFDGAIDVKAGQTIILEYNADHKVSGHIPTQYDLSNKVKKGDRLYIFDGKLITKVTTVKGKLVYIEAENSATIISRKGINLPDTNFDGDVITSKDRADLVFASIHNVDYVAQSFVQTAKDVVELKKILLNLGMKAKVIAKIETKSATDNLEEIVEEADAIMVARGDLAYELRPEAVPTIQKMLIELCAKYEKPIIIATQMLFSMTTSSEPTRAEISDVANAVMSGVDCLMLSDETAIGNYPIESVKLMKRVITYTESNNNFKPHYNKFMDGTKQGAISQAVVTLAESISAKAIVAETKSGSTANQISAQRSSIPIIAVTSVERVANQLSIVYNVKSYVRPADKMAASKLTDWLRLEKIFTKGEIVVTASGKYPGVVGTTDTIKVRVLE